MRLSVVVTLLVLAVSTSCGDGDARLQELEARVDELESRIATTTATTLTVPNSVLPTVPASSTPVATTAPPTSPTTTLSSAAEFWCTQHFGMVLDAAEHLGRGGIDTIAARGLYEQGLETDNPAILELAISGLRRNAPVAWRVGCKTAFEAR